MITKAGVPSNKIIVGVTSYGRSFQMVDPSCTGPDCLFTGGPEAGGSGATKGRCTGTAGYLSNAEIREIAGGSGVRTWYDKDSDSNIMTYNGDNWVAYMNDAVRASRTNLYKGYNMGGTTNWAVDLDKFHDPPNVIEGGGVTLSWSQIKLNIKATGDAKACNRELRSGNWVSHECTESEATTPLGYLAKERWEHLDCGSAWNDAKLRWQLCDAPAQNGSFSKSIAQFFHVTENSVSLQFTSGI
jgi:GH18 family chitinase